MKESSGSPTGTKNCAKKEIYAEKREIRGRMKRMRNALEPDRKRELDAQIGKCALEFLDNVRQTGGDGRIWVYTYISYGSEADTLSLIKRLWKSDVAVAAPRVDDAGKKQMHFYQITGMEDLVSGFQGILEPAAHCKRAEANHAVVITPALAFTREGGRIGYGGGYYDRFFEAEPEHLRVGLSYPFQIVERLPVEETDLRVQRIITAGEMFACGGSGLNF